MSVLSMEHQEAIYYDSYDQNSLLHISVINILSIAK